ncbi:C40 family peptidase [Streptacidiphilus cavernicola]|uniref:C40 family peptidase n=1 Tax=Streptacidiphilus cavernicola TaxID=3342716 RepID=A0ABV6VXM6_9ACTN
MPRAPRAPRRGSLLLATALAFLAAALPGAPRAAADDPSPAAPSATAPSAPSAPSAADVRAAQDNATRRAAEVAAVEAQLAAAQQAEQNLDIQAEQSVEAYNGARVRQQQAEADSAQAATEAATAAVRRETARQAAAALAVAQYRTGLPPALGAVQGLMRVQDLHSAELQEEALQAVQLQAASVAAAAADTAAAAATASAAAARAATAAEQAAAVVRQAAAKVQAELAAQHTEVARIAAQRGALLARLAAAQQVSVALATQRQQALAAAAAKAAAEAAAAAARQSADAAPSGTGTPYRAGDASAAVAFARAQLGLPYVWGGAGPDVFDCSGLTMRAWQHAGVSLPHFAADQYASSTPLSYHQLRPGDLVFWSHDGSPQDIYHVAIYLGGDQMIEAPRTGDVVKVASLWIMGTPDFYARPRPSGA